MLSLIFEIHLNTCIISNCLDDYAGLNVDVARTCPV